MSRISIISASVRTGRKSDRVATYFHNYITRNELGTSEILDLVKYDFPVFNERLKFQENPLAAAREFSEKIMSSDGVIIVTPEYNGGYPASIKNVIDLLTDEWKKKPVAIVTVSAGPFGGSQALTSLQFSLWKIGAWTVPAMFPVPNIEKTFDASGDPLDKEATDKRAGKFLAELKWCMEACARMKDLH